jgi:hypothetical protein
MVRLRRWLAVIAVVLGVVAMATPPVLAQAPASAKPEEKPKTLWDEITLFGYIENSYVWNLGHTGRDDVNELRFYDFDAGYSFNMAEFSIKKDPTDARPWGFGVVVTGGLDADRNLPRRRRHVPVPQHPEVRPAGGLRLLQDPDR